MKNLSALLLLTAISASCGDDKNTVVDGQGSGSGSGADARGPAVYKQVEHLGRPAINEALLFTFAYNNGYNATAPSFTGVDTATLNLVVGEAKTVLKAIYYGTCLTDGVVPGLTAATGLKPAGMQCPAIGGAVFTENALTGVTLTDAMKAAASTYADTVFNQFEPDVLRIDTAGPSSYLTLCGTATVANSPLLCGGRQLTDDVMDVTYDYLLGGAAISASSPAQFRALVSDGVVYDNTATNSTNSLSLSIPDPNNRNQGHPAPTATFPYSAPPI